MSIDVSPKETWDQLSQNTNSILIDVRSQTEWDKFGGPDLSTISKSVIKIYWLQIPKENRHQIFYDQILSQITLEQQIYVICKSGIRSKDASEILLGHGFKVFNVISGVDGWRAINLPWKI